MRNKSLIRFQLILLVAVVGLVVWRGKSGPSNIEGEIVLEDMSAGKLYRAGLRVDTATNAAVSVTASFETDDDAAPLATYGWILDNESLEVVWSTERSRLDRDGVLGVSVDTIHIVPGSYSVFYTTLGPTKRSIDDAPFLGLTPYWTNQKSSWHLSINDADSEGESRALIKTNELRQEKRTYDQMIWSTGPVSERGSSPFLFRVNRGIDLDLYAVGELCTPNCDYGWIENAKSGETIWEMDWDNTTPAGGAENNRVFDGSVHLSPGVYRAVFRSYGRHSVSNWHANPPFNPDGWGMTMYGVSADSVDEFDPWTDIEPFIVLTKLGNNEHEMIEFKVADSMSVLISALGEITSRGALYDYGWLENNATSTTIWEMSRENSLHAGGDGTNRVETAFVDLKAGDYTLHFKTDGGHAYENWSLTKPSRPERWGVVLFSIDRPADWDGIEIVYSTRDRSGWDGSSSRDTDTSGENIGEALVTLERVGNDADLYDSFDLEEEEELFVIAQGEINTGGRWDYGWIDSNSTGERVWEMTLRNTIAAGGEDRNRRFEGTITLPAGSYTARYISDPSHAYGHFSDEAPDREEDWGIRIFRLSR